MLLPLIAGERRPLAPAVYSPERTDVENLIGKFGAIVKVRLSNPHPRAFVLGNGVTALPGTVEVNALVRARAAMTSILPELIQFPLGLQRFHSIPQPSPDGRLSPAARTYVVDLEVVGNLRFAELTVANGEAGAEFAEARSLLREGASGEPPVFHVILGRDVLRLANLM